jgi:hypothetical protein
MPINTEWAVTNAKVWLKSHAENSELTIDEIARLSPGISMLGASLPAIQSNSWVVRDLTLSRLDSTL